MQAIHVVLCERPRNGVILQARVSFTHIFNRTSSMYLLLHIEGSTDTVACNSLWKAWERKGWDESEHVRTCQNMSEHVRRTEITRSHENVVCKFGIFFLESCLQSWWNSRNAFEDDRTDVQTRMASVRISTALRAKKRSLLKPPGVAFTSRWVRLKLRHTMARDSTCHARKVQLYI